MARYEKIREIGENLWIEDCPVWLFKGSLLYDSRTNRNILQLGFESLVKEKILGMDISYRGYSMGQELLIDTEFTYLDICMTQNDKVGEKIPIYLDDNNARYFDICVKRVFYENSTWENTQKLKLIPCELQEIETQLSGELCTEFRRIFNHPALDDLLCVPKMYDNYWICTCRTLNLKNKQCRRCSIGKEQLKTFFDKQYLQDSLHNFRESQRKEEEERIAREKIKKRKRIKIALGVIITAAVIIISCVSAEHFIIQPQRHIRNAEYLIKQTKFKEAKNEYVLANYSSEDIQEKFFVYAQNYIKEGDVESAISCYNYTSQDAQNSLKKVFYDYGVKEFKIGEDDNITVNLHLNQLYQLFMKIKGYRDSESYYNFVGLILFQKKLDKRYSEMKKMDISVAKEYLMKNKNILFFEEICGNWVDENVIEYGKKNTDNYYCCKNSLNITPDKGIVLKQEVVEDNDKPQITEYFISIMVGEDGEVVYQNSHPIGYDRETGILELTDDELRFKRKK